MHAAQRIEVDHLKISLIFNTCAEAQKSTKATAQP
jgi:hypothetical protein